MYVPLHSFPSSLGSLKECLMSLSILSSYRRSNCHLLGGFSRVSSAPLIFHSHALPLQLRSPLSYVLDGWDFLV